MYTAVILLLSVELYCNRVEFYVILLVYSGDHWSRHLCMIDLMVVQ